LRVTSSSKPLLGHCPNNYNNNNHEHAACSNNNDSSSKPPLGHNNNNDTNDHHDLAPTANDGQLRVTSSSKPPLGHNHYNKDTNDHQDRAPTANDGQLRATSSSNPPEEKTEDKTPQKKRRRRVARPSTAEVYTIEIKQTALQEVKKKEKEEAKREKTKEDPIRKSTRRSRSPIRKSDPPAKKKRIPDRKVSPIENPKFKNQIRRPVANNPKAHARDKSPTTKNNTLPTTYIERADAEGFKTGPPMSCYLGHTATIYRMYTTPSYQLTCAECDRNVLVDDLVSICHACEPTFLACLPCSIYRCKVSTDRH
jgi:hypothetical protein